MEWCFAARRIGSLFVVAKFVRIRTETTRVDEMHVMHMKDDKENKR